MRPIIVTALMLLLAGCGHVRELPWAAHAWADIERKGNP